MCFINVFPVQLIGLVLDIFKENMMVNIQEFFDTENEAMEWMASYYDRYHPIGYGTSLVVKETMPNDEGVTKWVVTGSRGSSCE